MQNKASGPQVNEISPNEFADDELAFQARGTPTAEKPYCWQSKLVLRAIRAAYANDPRLLPYLMSTYLALSEIASDEGRPCFTKSIAEILAKAGGSYRKLTDVLGLLARLGLVHVRHNFFDQGNERGKAPSTYTLLTSARYAEPLGTLRTQSVPIEEKNANAKNNKETQASTGWRAHYSEEELIVVDEYNRICGPRGWRAVNADGAELHVALERLQGHDIESLRAMFAEAVDCRDAGDPEYNTPRGNKLIRILVRNF